MHDGGRSPSGYARDWTVIRGRPVDNKRGRGPIAAGKVENFGWNLQNERCSSSCRLGNFAELGSLRDQLRPQLGAGGVVQLLRQDRERLGTHLDFDPGVGLEVVVPVRVGWRSSMGGDDREAAVFLGKQPSGETRSIPDLAPTWWTRISVVPAHGPPTRPSLARNSSMILAL
jgi:hypothetical protein